MKVMPYDPSHEELYNAFIMKTERKPRFFSAKPTDRKHFETVTTLLKMYCNGLAANNVMQQKARDHSVAAGGDGSAAYVR